MRAAAELRLRGEDPIAVVGRLVERLRARPLSGFGLDADGNRVRVRLNEPAVAALIQSGYANVPMYRDLPAAIPAFEARDRAPLLRLFAENKLDTASSPVRGFSEGLYLAVTCHDYPQLWDPVRAPAARREQLAGNVTALAPAAFAPIAPAVWTGLDYEGAIACLNWPGAPRPDPQVPPGAIYPAVPTLVLNGDLDNITASSGARGIASRFPRATFVETANTVHISAIGDRDGCAAPMVSASSAASTRATRAALGESPRSAPSTASPVPPRKRCPPPRAPATAARPRPAAPPLSRPPPWPTRSSAGCSTTAARAAGCAAAAGTSAANAWCASASGAPASRGRPGQRDRDVEDRRRLGPRDAAPWDG